MPTDEQSTRLQNSPDARETISSAWVSAEPSNSSSRRLLVSIPLILISIAVFQSKSYSQTAVAPDSAVSSVKDLFNLGVYSTAELQARRLLDDKRLSDSDRVEVEKYLAFALVAQGRNEAAEEHFVAALKIDSALTLDPVLTSPKIVAVFESAKTKFLAVVSASKTIENPKQVDILSAQIGPTYRAIVFPGWEQLYRGRRTKGFILAGAGAAAAVAAVTSDLLRRNARTNYLNAQSPSSAASLYKTYDLYYKTEVYSVSAFALIYLYSELDAFLNLPPHFGAYYSPSSRAVSFSLRLPF